MKLSIIDQAPISSGQTPREALMNSVQLAQVAESLGYTRYWIAEHHNLPGLACPAPEVMLGLIGGQTNSIRIGSGAVLLPHYRPYKVAELFNMLATLFPGRVDIGIGRAPGGSAEASNALSENFLQNVWKLPERLDELLLYLYDAAPPENEHAKLSASPVPKIMPDPWLLGTSEKSAALAAEKGLAYNFGQFMSDQEGISIVRHYVDSFQQSITTPQPKVTVTVSAVCAKTSEQAKEIAASSIIWSIQRDKGEGNEGIPTIQEAKDYPLTLKEKDKVDQWMDKMIVGTPEAVSEKLLQVKETYEADEIMIHTNVYSHKDRIQSYRLIAEALLNPNKSE
ncbi:LLM class flavin-dependent oxidoreductase [Siminovitchia sediminis]|uniref:LLM class flavin-dependent oxidoreductase n=1 Tax=Siminovitchia sediminis TaxID=1274353 RepID=A0ABW4KGJ9_9BACI